MFIIDCTGSMSSWIEASKNYMIQIIDFIRKNNEGALIRVSIVAYRDICDPSTRFEVKAFTDKIDELIVPFISKLSASGGGDTPQDLLGGLELAVKQSWNSRAKFAIIITDAPCHGRKYHDTDDSYPDGDPLR